MRIILSRKGFDSGYGECPSPILPDGRMLSLPIPRCEDELAYSEIRLPEGKSYDQIIEELGARSKIRNKGAHLDPDLVPGVRPRRTGWRPSLGHTLKSKNRAAELLEEYKVSKGDMFLFFGTFQHTKEEDGQLCYSDAKCRAFHAIFGYLEIEKKCYITENTELPRCLYDHPHAIPYRLKKGSIIYVASRHLSFNPNFPGGGAFQYDDQKMLSREGLTKKGKRGDRVNKSEWNLDSKIFRHLTFSCDENKKKEDVWKEEYYQSPTYPCQEIVIHADAGVIQWASNLVKDSRLWLN